MGTAAADGTAVRFNRTERKTAAGENLTVRIVHILIGFVQSFFVFIKCVGVLHYKFTAAHQTETGTAFIPEFILDLVERKRQLSVRIHIHMGQCRNHFFVGRSQTVIMSVPVFQAPHLCTVYIPAAALLPDFRRLYNRHQDFLGVNGIQFFPDNRFDFLQDALRQRQIGIHAGSGFSHITRPQHQFMAGDFCFCRDFT